MKKKVILFSLLLINIFLMGSFKKPYGGEITIYLQEPSSLEFSMDNYSNFIISTLLYEPFFYIDDNGGISSKIFESFNYDKNNSSIILKLKKGGGFSDGSKVESSNIIYSLRDFFTSKRKFGKASSAQVSSVDIIDKLSVKIKVKGDGASLLKLLCSPELVLKKNGVEIFSGPFSPQDYSEGKYLILKSNKYYMGGSPYLEQCKIVFEKVDLTDLFLQSSQTPLLKNYKELNSGVYQNIYLAFPPNYSLSKERKNAFFILCRKYLSSELGFKDLEAFTSNEESPVALNFPKLSKWRALKSLVGKKYELYLDNSLDFLKGKLNFNFSKDKLKINIKTINSKVENTKVNGLWMTQVLYHKRQSISLKIVKLIKHLTYLNDVNKYRDYINQLREMDFIRKGDDDDVLLNLVSQVITNMVSENLLLPLFHLEYKLRYNNKIQDLKIDSFGRINFADIYLKRR